MGMQENNMLKTPSLEATEEELKIEFQEIMKKRTEYQKQIEQEIIAFQKEERERNRRRFSKMVRAAVIVLVAGTCFVVLAAKSEATRMWWLTSVERIIGKDTGHVVDNDENRVISDMSEHEAVAEIEDKTGIPMPELKYKPQDLVFDGFEYDESVLRGRLYYLYGKYNVRVSAYSTDKDNTYMWNSDGEVVSEEYVETDYATVRLTEIQAENEEIPCATAEWKYHNYEYQIVGKLPVEELEKIILNILY